MALFAAFVALQFATLFGGQGHVLDTAGLTYAEYARSGFAQLLAVAALTFAVIGAARRWAPGERAAAGGAVPARAGRAASRRSGASGSTRRRSASRGCASPRTPRCCTSPRSSALVLVTRSPRALVALTAGAVLAFALADPERRIAEHNVERYERTGKIDVVYLEELGADAVPALARRRRSPSRCVGRRRARGLQPRPGRRATNEY